MRKVLILILVIGSLSLSFSQVLTSTEADSSKLFWLLQPEDSTAIKHEYLTFTWSMPEYNVGRLLSYEFRWGKVGVCTVYAHVGFDTMAYYHPYLCGDGLYYWNVYFHEGGSIIINNPTAVPSRNGPFIVIVDSKPADVTFSPVETVSLDRSGILSLGFISDEELNTSITKGIAVINDMNYPLTASQTYPPLTYYTLSLNLNEVQLPGAAIASLEVMPFDLVENASDTLNARFTIAAVQANTPLSIQSPDSLCRLDLKPEQNDIIVLWPELTGFPVTEKISTFFNPAPESHFSKPGQTILEQGEVVTQANSSLGMANLNFLEFAKENLPLFSFQVNSPITLLTKKNSELKNSALRWKYEAATVKARFDSILGGGNSAFDERKIGLYRFDPQHKRWQYLGGEGAGGMLETGSMSLGTLALLYNNQHEILPETYALAQNYPNPFNNETHIAFELPQDSRVRLEIYNTLGQKVATIVNELKSKGRYRVTWNGKDENGRPVSSGSYFYRIKMDNFVQTRRMLLIK